MRTKSDVGELVARLFDRLPGEFPDFEIQEALLVVELHDPQEPEATYATIECTSDRVTVRAGMLEFGHRTLFQRQD